MRILLLSLLSLLLMSCATTSPEHKGLKRYDMYPAQMMSMTKGTELQLQLGGPPFHWNGEVLVRARNPQTNEILTGHLMLMDKQQTSTTSTVTNSWGVKTGEIQSSNNGLGQQVAKGLIKGDKGTILNITLDVERGMAHGPSGGAIFFYRGFGEAQDNHGDKYVIQFPGHSQQYWYKNDDILFQQTNKDFLQK